jgi:hypothetical protein
MGSKTRKKVHRKKRVGGSKRRTTRRTVRRKVHYGGALTDYLPAAENIPGYSYLPNKESLPGYNFYKGVKAGYDLIASVGNVYDNKEPNISTAPPLPPLPKGGHPLIKRDIAHNRKIQSKLPDPTYDSKAMLDQINAARKNMPQSRAEENKGILQTIRKYKPIGTIDNVLKDLGLRDKVRKKLSQHKLGRFLVHGADTAIKFGFGRKRCGGSKIRKRRVHRRGKGLTVI